MNAVVMPFPEKIQRQAKRRLNRVEVEARHRWMVESATKWKTEAVGGAIYLEAMTPREIMFNKILDEKWGPVPKRTMTHLRHGIAEGRRLIEKRNRVKAWLAAMGADLDNIKDAEQALFAAFDALHAQR